MPNPRDRHRQVSCNAARALYGQETACVISSGVSTGHVSLQVGRRVVGQTGEGAPRWFFNVATALFRPYCCSAVNVC